MTRLLMFALLLLVLNGCKKEAVSADSAGADERVGELAKPGSMLAYEHELSFETPAQAMQQRVDAVRVACTEERFGACSVLAIESSDERKALRLRAVPAAIDPLVELAGSGGRQIERQTRAEDLAVAVQDVESQRDLLTRQRSQLLAFTERRDLGVSELISLSQQLASVDSQLADLNQTAAQQRRRIETNLLQLNWRSPYVDEGRNVHDLWTGFVDNLADGAYSLAEYLGYFLPLMLAAFPLALGWRWAWRRATRPRI